MKVVSTISKWLYLITVISTLTISTRSYSQIGIGTTNPHPSAILELESTSKGFLPPRLTETQKSNMVNPASGLMIYNLDKKCIDVNQGTPTTPDWNCYGFTPNITVFNGCNSNGIAGNYVLNQALTASHYYSINIQNAGTTSSGALNFATSDLSLSGNNGGITVASVSPTSANIPAGGNQVVTYQLTGTPTQLGNFTTSWSNSGLSCSGSETISGIPVLAEVCTGTNGLKGNYTQNSALNNTHYFRVRINNTGSAASGTLNFATSDLSLSGNNGGITVASVSPATATIAAGGNQVVTYQLTGTPTQSGNFTTSWSNNGLSCSGNRTISGIPVLAEVCTGTNGLKGNYTQNSALNNTHYFRVRINNTGSAASGTLNFATSDISLSGNNGGITVASVSPATANIAAGGNQVVTYQLTGTPTQSGNFTTSCSNSGLSCSGNRTVSAPIVTNDCNTNGIEGTYIQGANLTAANKFTVTINNTGTASSTQTFSTGDLSLSGVGGMTVSSVSPTSVNIPAGGSQLVTYQLGGTPAASGTLNVTWSKTGFTSCTKNQAVQIGNANFNFPKTAYILSTMDGSPQVNFQGVINNTTKKILIKVPYTGGVGSYAAFNGTYVANNPGTGQSDNNSFRITYPAGNFSASGVITVTIQVNGDGNFNIKKLLFNAENTIATLNFSINGESKGNIILKGAGGIPDRRYSDPSHRFVYAPILAEDGNIWLNNNLGANYANRNMTSVFDPSKQATSVTDRHAYGSHIQWGRFTDGHELMTYPTNTTANLTNPTNVTYTKSPTDVPGHSNFILAFGTPPQWHNSGDWRSTPNTNLWQGVNGTNNPCPVGYRVPTLSEFTTLISVEEMTNLSGYVNSLIFPNAGANGGDSAPGGYARYYTSTVNSGTRSRVVTRTLTGVPFLHQSGRHNGNSVRCIKN
ncbi:MAG: hypothetical protein N4A45_05105 [Flavobacteriales bacterium]|nr:hypothetical protein [Flavobacteriales bacterium]